MPFFCSTEWFQGAAQVIVLWAGTTTLTTTSALELPPAPDSFVFYCNRIPENYGFNPGKIIIYP